jgi:hypothetical protein
MDIPTLQYLLVLELGLNVREENRIEESSIDSIAVQFESLA